MATAATVILLIHLAWIVLVIFGALFTRSRPVWTTLHMVALVWGIIVETSPWPCPLTLAELYFENRAGPAIYQSNFLLRNLNAIVYPNIPAWAVTVAGVSVCALNLGIYGWRFWDYRRRGGPAS